MALLTGDELEKRCRDLGIDIEGDLIFQNKTDPDQNDCAYH